MRLRLPLRIQSETQSGRKVVSTSFPSHNLLQKRFSYTISLKRGFVTIFFHTLVTFCTYARFTSLKLKMLVQNVENLTERAKCSKNFYSRKSLKLQINIYCIRSDKMFKICGPTMGIHKFYEWQPLPEARSHMGYGPEGAFSEKLGICSGKLNKSGTVKNRPPNGGQLQKGYSAESGSVRLSRPKRNSYHSSGVRTSPA